MEEACCPFCLGENIRFIDDVNAKGFEKTRPLMGCNDCKKFFWDDNGKEIKGLHDLCETWMFAPFKCNEKVRNPLGPGFSTDSNYGELDLICSECPNRQFLWNEEMLKY